MIWGSENLFSLRGNVLMVKPNAGPELADRSINKRVRDVVNGYYWSDCQRFVTLAIPNAYTTGTVSFTSNSRTVAGSGTAWPIADEVNTVSPAQVRVAGYNKIKPQSMAGIEPGRWLLIDTLGSGLQEAVMVESAGADYFVSKFLNVHDPSFIITRSSLAGRQIRATYPLYTVTGVVDASTLLIDMPWGAASVSGVAYQILLAYVNPDPYCRRVKFGYDPTQGIPLDVDQYTYEQVIRSDAQLSAIQDPFMMCPVPPAIGGGAARWLLYPIQSSARAIGLVIINSWPKLIVNDDVPPPFMNPEMFTSGAIADCLRVRNIPSNGRVDPYHDPSLAMTYEAEFQKYRDQAENEDQARSATNLASWIDKCRSFQYSDSYYQSHPGWPTQYA